MAEEVRRSVIAGSWYPGSEKGLRATLDEYFEDVDTKEGKVKDPIALISPHAGYSFSGPTAAYAYHTLKGKSYDAIVILSPLHRLPLGKYVVTKSRAYETPLGEVPVDRELVEALEKEIPINRSGYDGEHSLEIQLPLLQYVLGNIPILPVMLGTSSLDDGAELGKVLAKVLGDRNALIVASSDLHHIEDFEEVATRDKTVTDALATFDLERIKKVLSPRDCSVCGRVPIMAALTAAKELGADAIDVLSYTNSAEVTGQKMIGQYTVGYCAAAAFRKGGA